MPLYNYRAIDRSGSVATGAVEALHESDLTAQLERMGLTLLRAQVKRVRLSGKIKWSRRDRIQFFVQLETLTRAGVSLLETLQDMAVEDMKSMLGRVAGMLSERIAAGAQFGDALAAIPGAFSPVEIALVRAGETTGNLPEVLGEIAKSLRWQDELAAQTKKLLMYPSFVLVVISGVVVFLMTYLVPQLVSFIIGMGSTIPFHTRLLIAISEALVRWWWIILPSPLVLALLIALAAQIDPRIRRGLHRLMLKLPWIGEVMLKIVLARIVDTLALLYRAGIPLIEAIGYCREVTGNLVLRAAIDDAKNRIANGTALSEGFAATRVFPPLVIRMLRVGEATGQIDTALKNVSYFYSRDIDESIGRVQALIEPTLTVAMGLIIGWIMLSVLGPIYDTITKLKM